jgi:hypothetical protein
MERSLMVAMTVVVLGCGSALVQVDGGLGIMPTPLPLSVSSPLVNADLAVAKSSAGTSSSTLTLLFDDGGAAGITLGTCTGGGPGASVPSPTGIGSMSAGGRIGRRLGSTELRSAPKIALTDKLTPAEIQTLLRHVTAFDSCVLVQSREQPAAVGGRFACDHSCDGMTPTIDSLNLSRCDVIFFDVNGREATAIKGATATIKRFAPAIITTLPAEAASNIIDALQALDYRLVDKLGGEYVYVKGEPI